METQIQLGEEHVRLMELVAGVGRWEMDLDDHSISLSPAAQRMLGMDSASIALEELLSRISSQQDRKALLEAVKRARTGRKQFDLEIRVKRGSQPRVLRTYGRTLFNAGNPLLLGVVRESTS
jgi:PAS domain-containing protein